MKQWLRMMSQAHVESARAHAQGLAAKAEAAAANALAATTMASCNKMIVLNEYE